MELYNIPFTQQLDNANTHDIWVDSQSQVFDDNPIGCLLSANRETLSRSFIIILFLVGWRQHFPGWTNCDFRQDRWTDRQADRISILWTSVPCLRRRSSEYAIPNLRQRIYGMLTAACPRSGCTEFNANGYGNVYFLIRAIAERHSSRRRPKNKKYCCGTCFQMNLITPKKDFKYGLWKIRQDNVFHYFKRIKRWFYHSWVPKLIITSFKNKIWWLISISSQIKSDDKVLLCSFSYSLR